MRMLLIVLALVVFLAFVLRDANPIASVVVVVVLCLAALAHAGRDAIRHNLHPTKQILDWPVVQNIARQTGWVAPLLAFIEFLMIGIAGHYILASNQGEPYEYFRQFISCASPCPFSHYYTCFKEAYWGNHATGCDC